MTTRLIVGVLGLLLVLAIGFAFAARAVLPAATASIPRDEALHDLAVSIVGARLEIRNDSRTPVRSLDIRLSETDTPPDRAYRCEPVDELPPTQTIAIVLATCANRDGRRFDFAALKPHRVYLMGTLPGEGAARSNTYQFR